MFDLSVIIVTFNSEAFIEECLTYLGEAVRGLAAEVLVVDNASTDATVAKIRGKFPQVRVVENGQNEGFGKAHNLGLSQTCGRYRLLLNPDVFLTSSLKPLLEYLDTQPKVGILGVTLRFPSREIQPFIAGPRYTLAQLLLSHLNLSRPVWLAQKPLSVDWVTGAFFLLRQELNQTLGGFDEKFFLYFEDQDYCRRAQKAGWQVIYYPFYEALHYHGQSSSVGREVLLKAYYDSEARFFSKHYSRWEYGLWKTLSGFWRIWRCFKRRINS